MKRSTTPPISKPIVDLPRTPPVDIDPSDIALISKADVLARVPISFVGLWKMMQAVPPRFPRARVIGNAVCWYKHEIDHWLATEVPLRGYRDDVDGVKMPDTFQHERRRAAKKAAKAGSKKSGA